MDEKRKKVRQVKWADKSVGQCHRRREKRDRTQLERDTAAEHSSHEELN